jgi:hypothetical protein
MSNCPNQNIHPVSKEFNHIDLDNSNEKLENQIFINTVCNHFDEKDRCEDIYQAPAILAIEEGSINSNGSIEQDENTNKLMENNKRKAYVQNTLISNSCESMNNIQNDSDMVSLIEGGIAMSFTTKELLTEVLDQLLSKVYFQTEKQNNDKGISEASEREIEIDVCTKRREATYWEKTKSTSLKLITLFLPSGLLNDNGRTNNDTLPVYNPGQ